jgi:hypothetical protein
MASASDPSSQPGDRSPAPGGGTDPGSDPRREALIASLRQRFAAAEARGDAAAKQALFKEATYLNLPPELWTEPPA